MVKGTELPELGFIDEPLLVDASAEPLPKRAVVTCTNHFSAQADSPCYRLGNNTAKRLLSSWAAIQILDEVLAVTS